MPALLYGPGDVRHAHREDEFVPVADLHNVARTLAALVVRYCTSAP
jgi:acetylornithine deacetylase